MIRALLAITVLALPAEAQAQELARPLKSVLTTCGCVVPSMPETLLSTMVESDATFMKDDRGFVAAYWAAPHDYDQFDEGEWHVIAGDTKTGRWRQAQMPAEGTPPGLMGGRFERAFPVSAGSSSLKCESPSTAVRSRFSRRI